MTRDAQSGVASEVRAVGALFAAAGDPKEILWFEGRHSELPGYALKAMWAFLARHLGVDARTR